MTTGQSVTRAHTDQSTHGDAGGGNARLPGPRSAPAHSIPESLNPSIPDLSVSLARPKQGDWVCVIAYGVADTEEFFVSGTNDSAIARDVLMARFALASERLRALPRYLPALDAVAGGLLAELEAETYPRAVRS